MVRVERIRATPSIVIDRTVDACPPKLQTQIDGAWETLCAGNPRYYNAPILCFDSYDDSTGVIQSRIEEYKHHAVRDSINLGHSLLAVTGVLRALGREGLTMYFIGKRSPSTHRYGNLWEFGPCGGIDVPESNHLSLNDITSELKRESNEETGVELGQAQHKPIALVHDEYVGSTDIVLRVTLSSIPETSTGWEYADAMWISHDELSEWMTRRPNDFIPTARPIMSLLDDPGATIIR